MIRVKVLSVREIVKNIFVGISFAVVIFCTMMLLSKFMKLESRTFAYNIVEENLNLNSENLNDGIHTKILVAELGLESNWKKSNDKLKDEVDENVYIEDAGKEENQNMEQESNIKIPSKYMESSVIRTWDRPKTYNVSELTSGKIQVGNVCISNYSKLKLDFEELSKVSEFKIDDNTNVLIVHTHTSEAYSEIGASNNFRTLDDSKNIVSAGNVLKENLLLRSFKVKHSTIKHDTPSYNGAYKACLQTVENEFKNTKYDIVLDIHRDALSGNLNFRPTAEINGESAAKLMFVVGTNAAGVSHDNWMENLKLALLIQNTANEMYPGLFRDLNLSKSRYNQHVSDGALILEVGATGNTLEEVWNAMKYFSNVLQALKQK